MKNVITSLLLFLFAGISVVAQVGINSDGSQPDNSAMLDVKSTTMGLLVPRMTITERDAISNPATGLLIFCIGENQYYCNKGTPATPNWMMVSSQWLVSGTDIYFTGGRVGLGLENPAYPLHVAGDINFTGTLRKNGLPVISGVSGVTANSPLMSTGGANPTISISQANSLTNGFLSSDDWNTFNNKQSTLTFANLTSSDIIVNGGVGAVRGTGATLAINKGNLTSTDITVSGGSGSVLGAGTALTINKGNLTESGSSVLTITGSSNTVLGTGTSIQVKQANTSQSGYLSTADWNSFNNKVSSQWTANGLKLHYTPGNVGIGTTAPDSRLVVKGVDDGMFTYNVKFKDNSDRTVVSFTNNGRIDQSDYTGAGAVSVLYNLSSTPFDNETAGHYAFGALNDVGHGNTVGYTMCNVTDVSEVSMDSKLLFGYMDNVNTTGGGSQPNKYMYLSPTGLLVPVKTAINSSTSPSSTLHVTGSARVTDTTILLGRVGIGTASPTSLLHLKSLASATPLFTASNNKGAGFDSTVVITATGNVGIGTSNPQNKIDIAGNAVIGSTYSGASVAPANGLLVEGQVGVGTTSPAASAALEVKSTNSGVLLPRMTHDQRNTIAVPAEGLMVFCTNCGLNGALSIYSTGAWRTFIPCRSDTPAAVATVLSPGQIIWNWNPVTGAAGYKWNTSDNYDIATDMGTAVSKTETGISCGTTYTRYVWAYNECGISIPVTLSQSVSASVPESPSTVTHVSDQTSIVWNWNTVADAIGYKWNITDDFSTATEMDATTTKTETGLTCASNYTRYVWSYNGCGYSTPVILTQSTLACWICGDPFTINHVAGTVAPVSKTVIYGTVKNIPGELTKCWITSNLGADHQASAVDDATEASAGWYWQFNHKQGFKLADDGLTRTPNTTWIYPITENSDWTLANDPCALQLGNGWRIPTVTEWINVNETGG